MTFENLSEAFSNLTQPELYCVVGLALLLVLVLLFLIRKQPKQVVAYVTENGRVMVSRSAIVELVQTSCEQLQDVSKPHVKIKVKRGTTHFEIRIKLLNGGRLREVEETLQGHLRLTLVENLGIEKLGRINIVATGYKSGRIEANVPQQHITELEAEIDDSYAVVDADDDLTEKS